MQVKELSSSKSEKEYSVIIPAKEIEAAIESNALEIAKEAKIDGFRVGKVPVSVIKKRYKENILSETLDDLINKTSQKIIEDNKLTLATRPNIQISSFVEGKDLEYKAKFELFPEIPAIDYSKCGVTEFICEIGDEEVTKTLNDLRKNKKELKPATGKAAAKEGDTVVINFVGYIDDKEFPGGKAEDYKLELGAGHFIPGFESGLVGSKAGEEVKLDLKFPKDYGSKDHAGKKVVFNVTVKEIMHTILPELTDEFAKSFGAENLEGLKKAIKADLEKRYSNITYGLTKKELLDVLDEQIKCDMPKTMVESELENLNKQLTAPGAEIDEKAQVKYRKIAERRVKLGLVLSETAKLNKLSITQDDIRGAIINYAQSMPGQEQMVIDYFTKNPQAVENLKGPIIEDKAVRFILSKTTNKPKHLSTEKLIELVKKNEEDNAIV
jgi:trigger factor